MQLKNQKKNLNKKNLNKKKDKENNSNKKIIINKNIKLIITLSIILLFLISFLLFSIFVLDLPFITLKENKINKNPLLEIANDMYDKGFLENSAINYQNYLNTNPAKKEKFIIYDRMFEIYILLKKYPEALQILDNWENLDPKIPKIYINRLKLYLRNNNFAKAKILIDDNYKKLNNSVEFKELISVYYIKTEQYEKALKELEKIKYQKREFSAHKKIIHSLIKLKKYNEALIYLTKIESKIKTLEDKEKISQYAILKTIVLLLKGDVELALNEINKALASEKYSNIAIKLKIYSNIILDYSNNIDSLFEENFEIFKNDFEFIKSIGDYFIYKNDYQKALDYYEKIIKYLPETKENLMTLSDIYYKTNNYEKTILYLTKLNYEYNYKESILFKNLSFVYSKINDYKNFLFYLKEGLNYYPDDIDYYVALARYYIDLKDSITANYYINQGLKISKNNYDKRLELLRILSREITEKNINERELLELREKDFLNVENYFKLIEYYLKNNNYSNARREIESVEQLSLSNNQKNNLYFYKIILANAMKNKIEYEKYKEIYLNINSTDYIININKSILNILDKNYDEALKILSSINLYNITDNELLKKIYYLKSVVYYYKNDNSQAYKFITQALIIDPNFKKGSYLKYLLGVK